MMNTVPCERKKVRRERRNTPNWAGKQQQKRYDILVDRVSGFGIVLGGCNTTTMCLCLPEPMCPSSAIV
jgi:hypothetical protein